MESVFLKNEKAEISKKEKILSLFRSGLTDIRNLSQLTDARPSYVASVLQSEGLISGYFDLYTNTSNVMNVYGVPFAGKLGFKTKKVAERSLKLIDIMYRYFERTGDRAGQHHALMTALLLLNRARWSGKTEEANVFRYWLLNKLVETESAVPDLGMPVPTLSKAS